MIEIKLKDDYDATFMLAMIFIHDFLHDFNAVNFSSRLKTIRKSIDEFTDIANKKKAEKKVGKAKKEKAVSVPLSESVPGPVPLPLPLSESVPVPLPLPVIEEIVNPEDFFDADDTEIKEQIIDEDVEEEETEESSTDTIPFSREWQEAFSGIEIEGYFSSVLELFLKRPATRLRTRIIEITSNYIDETKLFVLGFVSLLTTGGDRVMNDNNLFSTIGKFFDTTTTETSILQKKSQPESAQPYSKLCQMVRNALDSAIAFAEDEEFADYFKFMKTLYLYYEDETQNPFSTLNNIHIEKALLLYILDTKKVYATEKNVHAMLETLQKNYTKQTGGSIMKGGDIEGVKTYIESTDAFMFSVVIGESDIDAVYSKYIISGNVAETTTKLDSLNSYVTGLYPFVDPDTLAILKTKEYDSHKKSIDSKYSTAIGNTDITNRRYESSKKDFITASILFLKYVYSTIIQHEANVSAKLQAEIDKAENSSSLTPEQKQNVQMVSVTVATAGNKYMLGKMNKNNDGYRSNSILRTECETIIEPIIRNQHVPGTIDETIRNAFISYARGSPKFLGSLAAIKPVVKQYNKDIVVVNNAATDALKDLGIAKQKHICPTSSVSDAQGIFGSCSGKIQNKEFYPMDFQIKNASGSIYYHGKTELKTVRGKTETKITYEANINDFYLPEVEINIDIGDNLNILSLSANTTFKYLLTTIISIWDRLFKNKPNVTTTEMWNALQSKLVFIEMVSCGSIKSVGDLFQEINAVAEYGGYDQRQINPSEFNKKFRIGANGDQPSGVRAAYMLLRANSGVNKRAMAGYLTQAQGVFAIRNDIGDQPVRKGGRKTKKTNRKTRKQGKKRVSRKYI